MINGEDDLIVLQHRIYSTEYTAQDILLQPNQTKPNQLNQTKLNQLNQTKPNQTKPNQPNQTNQTKPNKTK